MYGLTTTWTSRRSFADKQKVGGVSRTPRPETPSITLLFASDSHRRGFHVALAVSYSYKYMYVNILLRTSPDNPSMAADEITQPELYNY